MSKLSNKVALVTGGNSGIGLATAKLYKDEGAQVIITARSSETFEKAKKEYGNVFDVVQTDVSKMEDLDRLYAHIKSKYGKLDVIFANAGIALTAPTAEVTPEFFDNQFNTNVKGVYFTIAKALPILAKGSAVVLNASVVASKGFVGSSVYSATKAAVRNFARTWTAEIPVDQVRFNVLSPGPIETPIFGKMGMPDEHKAGMAAGLPIKRLGRPEEMARVALFLASDDSSYLAGAEIMADGGFGQV
ncbi:SDR family oxidoreductase [Peredibacter sp. HCB2-198]|uniref:SDR family oxidoreductase n=1 Tax=Peredibacter sp. HCB2-198 TaxID=3383025 RepID=UPI0038B46CA1